MILQLLITKNPNLNDCRFAGSILWFQDSKFDKLSMERYGCPKTLRIKLQMYIQMKQKVGMLPLIGMVITPDWVKTWSWNLCFPYLAFVKVFWRYVRQILSMTSAKTLSWVTIHTWPYMWYAVTKCANVFHITASLQITYREKMIFHVTKSTISDSEL